MGILADIDALYAGGKAAPATDAPFFPEQPSAFSRGLRAGGEDAAGQARALLGQGGELLGANDFAARQRAASLANQQEAERLVEGVPQSYRQVDSLRSGWDYATGLVGRAGPGMVPMALGAAAGGIPGMIAATVPSTVGAQFEQQQADPVQAATPLGQRTLTGLGAGVAEAAVMGTVPAVMGGKLFGKAAAREALPLGRALAENVPEAVVGNAAAGNVAARIGQAAATSLNPERDTSADEQQQLDATVGGAVMGAPFAALGTVGAMRGTKAAKPGKVPDIKPTEPGTRAPTFDAQLATLGETLKPDLVTGREHADAAITGDETVESMAAKDAAGEALATTKARAKIDKLLADPEAAHLHAELSKLDPATTDGQSRIGELNVEHFTALRLKKSLAEDSAALDEALAGVKKDEPSAASKDYAGADKQVYEAMDGPEWADFSDAAKQQAASNVRKAVELAEQTGRIPKLQAQRDVFGTDPVARLMRVYKVLDSGDPQARERFFGALETLGARTKHDDGLAAAVRSALPEKMQGISEHQVNEFIAGMKALSSETLSKTMGANELKVAKTRIDDHLYDIFGAEQADKLNDAFAQHAKAAEKLVPADVEEAAKIKSAADKQGEAPGEGAEVTDALGETTRYYGRTPDGKSASPFELNNLAHTREYPNAPEETRPQNVKLAKAREENPVPPDPHAPDAPPENVRWMSAREYADTHNMDPKDLAAHTKGKPDDYGIAAVRVPKADEFTLSDGDVKAMSIARHVKEIDPKTGEVTEKHLAARASWKDSPSAFEAGDHVFDASRVASYMARKNGKNMEFTAGDDEHGGTYRTARAFAEGLAALKIKLGREIAIPDDRVVVKAKDGRPALTWGHLQQVLKDGKEAASADLAPLRAQRAELAAAREAIHAKLDKSAARDLGTGDLANVRRLVRQLEANARDSKAVEEQIAAVRKAHGLDREQWDSNDSTTAELEATLTRLTLALDKSEQAMARFKALAAKRTLTEREQGNADFHAQRVEALGQRVEALEKALEGRAEQAGLQETKEGDGVREADPLGQVHQAAAEHKSALGVVAAKVRAKAGAFTETATPRDKAPVTPEQRWATLNTLADTLAKDGKGGLRTLVDNRGIMSEVHQKELGKLVGGDGLPKSNAGIGATLKDLTAKYRTDPRWSDTGEHTWAKRAAEGGEAHQAILKKIDHSGDPKALHSGLLDLLADKAPNAHKAAVIDALNERIGTLMAKRAEDAYQMQLKSAQDVAAPTPAQTAFHAKVAKGGLPLKSVLDSLKGSDDVAALWRAYGALQKGDVRNPHIDRALSTISDRLAELQPKGELSREKTGAADSTAKAQADVHDYVNKVTGGDALVNAAAKLLYAGSYIEGGKDAAGADYRPVINVSVHALDPLSTAYHESLHWLADHLRQHGDPQVFAALSKAADSAYVRNFLRTKFKDQPDALKQVEGSVEERVAYMYQFHKNGELQLGSRGKTILDHISDFIDRVFGVWSNDARALHIMDYFGSGRYADAVGGNAKSGSEFARKAMMEVGRNKTLDRLHANIKPLRELGDAMAGIGSQRIRDMGIPALTKIADLVRLHGTKEGVDGGYLPEAGVARRAMGMDLVNRMTANNTRPFTFEQANDAFARIGLGEKTGRNADEQRLMDAMRTSMSKVHAYLKEAGVMVGDRGLNADYTPRVWDPGFIAGNQDAFRTMIQKYIGSGDFKGSADDLMSRLMRDEGSEVESPLARPGDQHVKTRELHFIKFEDAQPFLQKDAMRVLSSYIAQASRRAEWSRRFEAISTEEKARIGWDAMTSYQRQQYNLTRVKPLDVLREAAIKQGATPDQMALMEAYLLGVTGQLGTDVKPGTRKLFSQIMVYQNLRLLPLGFFSTLIDPLGVKVRGGSMGDVFNNFKRAILEIPRGFQKIENRKLDTGYGFAEDLGVIDSAVLQHVLGAAYGLGAAGDKARRINEMVFKYNLMDQMNTSQRVGATEAAMRFLLRHKDGDASEHSMRYLGELGVKPADIKVVGKGKDARVAVRQEDFTQLGYNQQAALNAHMTMRQAVNRWVDGAILRPDQSQKSIWMNDPLWSLVAHMKQFSFAFQDTILKRVVHESRHGNYEPAYALAGYIPVMLAADLARGAVQGGGSQPDWKHDWDLGDYLSNATQRAGLFGVGQFGVDAVRDMRHGGLGVGALGGPTVSQLSHAVATVGGRRSLESTVLEALPANALWSGYLPGAVTAPASGAGHRGGDTTDQLDSSRMAAPN